MCIYYLWFNVYCKYLTPDNGILLVNAQGIVEQA